MTSDSLDSRRKHRRSASDDDSPDDSKPHKHRHHRHHHRRHRHHHRRSSKKRDVEDKTDEIEEESRSKLEGAREVVVLPPHADYDMEEGEIIEDGGGLIIPATVKKAESDMESGEFKVVEGQSEFDDSYTIIEAGESLIANSHPVAYYGKKNNKNLKSRGSYRSDDSEKYGNLDHNEETSVMENVVNHDCGGDSGKVESMFPARNESPSKGSSKQTVPHENERKSWLDLMEVDKDEHGECRNSSSHNVERHHKELSHSPSHGKYHLETSDKSILRDERSRMQHHHEGDERLYDSGKVHSELDDERYTHRSMGYRFDGRYITKDKGRETSSNHHRSRNRDEDGDTWSRERETCRDEKKTEDQEISRERTERDHDRDRGWDKERDRTRGRDREIEKESVRDRDRNRVKARETKNDVDQDRRERDMEKRREINHGRSRDRDLERERRRDSSISTYRDRGMEKGRDLEMDGDRDRNGDRDRYGNIFRDAGNDRSRKHHRYDDGYGYRDRHHYDETNYCRDRDMKHDSAKDRGSKDDFLQKSRNGVNRVDDDPDYQERVELELAEREEDDINRIKEESRRRREAILQKYKARSIEQQAVPEKAQAPDVEPKEQCFQNLAITNVIQGNIDANGDGQYTSAVETIFSMGESPPRNGITGVKNVAAASGMGEGTPKSERSTDMFCDDIFGDSPTGVRKTVKGDGRPIERSGLHDNWDDPEGYYSFRLGEILDSRYEITAAHGKGVFSTVVRAKDLNAGPDDREEVAIKIIRNNETMLKAGTAELVILKKLVGADPDDRRHCVRYISHFKYRNHLCIVFESLYMNLREVLKKFGRDIGLKLTGVRAYAQQLFIALKHLRNCGVLHCDIKPDNMLVNELLTVLKLCDFGNAMFAGKNEITPYLVSRFYRAPEIILGLPYDHPMDIWSVGCCLYELFTGRVLFPGSTNNDMLRLHMELKGPFPKKMLRKGAFIERHFDQDLNFLATEEDPVSKKAIRRLILNIKPKDIGTIVKGSIKGSSEDPKMFTNFKDLLDKIFVIDPDKRLTVAQALNHPFITGK